MAFTNSILKNISKTKQYMEDISKLANGTIAVDTNDSEIEKNGFGDLVKDTETNNDSGYSYLDISKDIIDWNDNIKKYTEQDDIQNNDVEDFNNLVFNDSRPIHNTVLDSLNNVKTYKDFDKGIKDDSGIIDKIGNTIYEVKDSITETGNEIYGSIADLSSRAVNFVGQQAESVGNLVGGLVEGKANENYFDNMFNSELTTEEQKVYGTVGRNGLIQSMLEKESFDEFSIKMNNIMSDDKLSNEEKGLMLDNEAETYYQNRILRKDSIGDMTEEQTKEAIMRLGIKRGKFINDYIIPAAENLQKEQGYNVENINKKYLTTEELKEKHVVEQNISEKKQILDVKLSSQFKDVYESIKNDISISDDLKKNKLNLIVDKTKAISQYKDSTNATLSSLSTYIEKMEDDLDTGRSGRGIDGGDISNKIKETISYLKGEEEKIRKNYFDLQKEYLKSDEKDFNVFTKSRLQKNNYERFDDAFGIRYDVNTKMSNELAPDEMAKHYLDTYREMHGGGVDKFLGVLGHASYLFQNSLYTVVHPIQDTINSLATSRGLSSESFGVSSLGLISESKKAEAYIKDNGLQSGLSSFGFGLLEASDEIANFVGLTILMEGAKLDMPSNIAKGVEAGGFFSKVVKGAINESIRTKQIDRLTKGASGLKTYLKSTEFMNATKNAGGTLKYLFDGLKLDKKYALTKGANFLIDSLGNVSISKTMSIYYDSEYVVGSEDFIMDMAFQVGTLAIDVAKVINHIPKGTIEYSTAFSEEFARRMAKDIDKKTWNSLPQETRNDLILVGNSMLEQTNKAMGNLSSGIEFRNKGQKLIDEGNKIINDIGSKFKTQSDKVEEIKQELEILYKNKEFNKDAIYSKGREFRIAKKKLAKVIEKNGFKNKLDVGKKLIEEGNKIINTKGNPDWRTKIINNYSNILSNTIEQNKSIKTKLSEISLGMFEKVKGEVYMHKKIVDKLGKDYLNDIIDYTYKRISSKNPTLKGDDLVGKVKLKIDSYLYGNNKDNLFDFVKKFADDTSEDIFTTDEYSKIKSIVGLIDNKEDAAKELNDLLRSKLKINNLKAKGIEGVEFEKLEKDFIDKLNTKQIELEKNIFPDVDKNINDNLDLVNISLEGIDGKIKKPTEALGKRGMVEIDGKMYFYHIRSDFDPKARNINYTSNHTTKYWLIDYDTYKNEKIFFDRYKTKNGNFGDYILHINGEVRKEHQLSFQLLDGEWKVSLSEGTDLSLSKSEFNNRKEFKINKEVDYTNGDTDYLDFGYDTENNKLYNVEFNGDGFFREIGNDILGEYNPKRSGKKGVITINDYNERDVNMDSVITLYHESLHGFVNHIKDKRKILLRQNAVEKVLSKDRKLFSYKAAEEVLIEELAKKLGKEGAVSLYGKFLEYVKNLIDKFTGRFFNTYIFEKNIIDPKEKDLILKYYNEWLGLTPEQIAENTFNKLKGITKDSTRFEGMLAMKTYYAELVDSIRKKGIAVVFDNKNIDNAFIDSAELGGDDLIISGLRTKTYTNKTAKYKDGVILGEKNNGDKVVANNNDVVLVDYTDDVRQGMINKYKTEEELINAIIKQGDEHYAMIIKNAKTESEPFGKVFINGEKYDKSIYGNINKDILRYSDTEMKKYIDLKNSKYVVGKLTWKPKNLDYYLFGDKMFGDLSIKNKSEAVLIEPNIGLSKLRESIISDLEIDPNTIDIINKKKSPKWILTDSTKKYLKDKYNIDIEKWNRISQDDMLKYANTYTEEQFMENIGTKILLGTEEDKNNLKLLMKDDEILKKFFKEYDKQVRTTHRRLEGADKYISYEIDSVSNVNMEKQNIGHQPFFLKQLGFANFDSKDVIKFKINTKHFSDIKDISMVENYFYTSLGKQKTYGGKSQYIISPISESTPLFVAFKRSSLEKNQVLNGIVNELNSIKGSKKIDIKELNDDQLSLLVYGVGVGTLNRKSILEIGKDGNTFGYNFIMNHMSDDVAVYFVKSAKYSGKYFSDRPIININRDTFLIKLIDKFEREDGARGLFSDAYNKYATPLMGGPVHSSSVSKLQVNFQGHNIKGISKGSKEEAIVDAIISGGDENIDILNKYIEWSGIKLDKINKGSKNIYEDIYNTVVGLKENGKLHGFVFDTAHKIYTNDSTVKEAFVLNLKDSYVSDYGLGGRGIDESTLQELPRQAPAVITNIKQSRNFQKLVTKYSKLKRENVLYAINLINKDFNKGMAYLKDILPPEMIAEFDIAKNSGYLDSYLSSLVGKTLDGFSLKGYGTKGLGISDYSYSLIKEEFKDVLNGAEDFILIKKTKDLEKMGFVSGDKIFFYRNPINGPKSLQWVPVVFIDDITNKHLISTIGQHTDTIHITKGSAKAIAGDFDGDDYYVLTEISKDRDFKYLMENITNNKSYKNFPEYKGDKKLQQFNNMFGIVRSRIAGKSHVGKAVTPHRMMLGVRNFITSLEKKGVIKNIPEKALKKLESLEDKIMIEVQKEVQDAVDGKLTQSEMMGELYNDYFNYIGELTNIKSPEKLQWLRYTTKGKKRLIDYSEGINRFADTIDDLFGGKKITTDDIEYIDGLNLETLINNVSLGRHKFVSDRFQIELITKALQKKQGTWSVFDSSSVLATLGKFDLLNIEDSKGIYKYTYDFNKDNSLFNKKIESLFKNIDDVIEKHNGVMSLDVDDYLKNNKKINMFGKEFKLSTKKDLNKLKDGEFIIKKEGKQNRLYLKDSTLGDIYKKKFYGMMLAINEVSLSKLDKKVLDIIPSSIKEEFYSAYDSYYKRINLSSLLETAGITENKVYKGQQLGNWISSLNVTDTGKLKYSGVPKANIDNRPLRFATKNAKSISNYTTSAKVINNLFGSSDDIKKAKNSWHSSYKIGDVQHVSSDRMFANILDELDTNVSNDIKKFDDIIDDVEKVELNVNNINISKTDIENMSSGIGGNICATHLS